MLTKRLYNILPASISQWLFQATYSLFSARSKWLSLFNEQLIHRSIPRADFSFILDSG